MKRFGLSDLPERLVVSEGFGGDFGISMSPEALSAVDSGRMVVKILRHGNKEYVNDFFASIAAERGRVLIFVGDDGAEIHLGRGVEGGYEMRLWRRSSVSIGEGTTSNGVRIFCDNSAFSCGKDCMFSGDVLIQTSDQHGIVDLESGTIINNRHRSVVLEDHVWLGRKSTLMPDAKVGHGTVIGACSVVTGVVPARVIAAGSPARVIKENRTWSRSPVALDHYADYYIKNFG